MAKKREQPKTPETKVDTTGYDFFVMPSEFRGGEVVHKVTDADKEASEKREQDRLKKLKQKEELEKAKLEAKKNRIANRKVSPIVVAAVLIAITTVTVGIVLYVSLNQDTEPIPEPDPEPIVTPDPEIIVERVEQGEDLDADGLTDIEERLYGTNPRNPDSDNDTFLDGNEVFHLYDPTTLSPSLLVNTDFVEEYEHAGVYSYSFLHPSAWDIRNSNDDELGFVDAIDLIISPTSKISFYHFDDVSQQTFASWFSAQAFDVDRFGTVEDYSEALTKEGIVMYQHENSRIRILDTDGAFILVEYQIGTSNRMDYFQTLQMVLNSYTPLP
jgi:hypothetical protein